MLAVGPGAVGAVDVWDQLLHKKSGERRRVAGGWAVGAVAIRQHDQQRRDLAADDQRVGRLVHADVVPVAIVVAGAVQQVDHRIAPVALLGVARRQIDPVVLLLAQIGAGDARPHDSSVPFAARRRRW